MSLEVIVLAAGKGTRMRSDRPKVLHALAGKPLLAHVLSAIRALEPDRIHVVCGHTGEALQDVLPNQDITWVVQAQQLGTGHAVQQALPGIASGAQVLVVYGDVPMLRTRTLRMLVDGADGAGLGLLTICLDNPEGYGRIVRDEHGDIIGIVEQQDANAEQLAINEINTGILTASATALKHWLSKLNNDNAQGEYYLTDIVAQARADGETVRGLVAPTRDEVLGVNSRKDLASLERIYQRRQASALMEQGVTIMDPDRLDVRGDVHIGRDCVLDVNVVLIGPVTVGDRVTIGPNNVISSCDIGNDVTVHPNCVIEQAVLGAGSRIGPFARIRPGAMIGTAAHVGNFVEIKNSELGAGSKVNHLSYVGDSSVGRDTNIGAGVITCNYDGAHKHRTEIGDDVFIGSNSQLVAPVKIAAGATVGAGSTITADVPKDTLAVTRARQRHIKGWRRPKRRRKA